MRKVFTEEKLQLDFEQNGYVKIPLLSEDEIISLKEDINGLRPNDNFAPSPGAFNPGTFHLSFFDTNIEYKREADNMIREVFTPYLNKILNNYQALHYNFCIKPPGQGAVGPHQDSINVRNMEEIGLVVWCPLVDVDERNGALWVVEGSHRIVEFVSTPSVPQYISKFSSNIHKYSKLIPLKAGECLIFDYHLIHWSADNMSDSPRIAIQSSFIPDDCRPVIYYFDQDHPEKGFEIFEVTDNYYIENNLQAFLKCPTGLKSIGFAENRNRLLTEDEFVELLKQTNYTGDLEKGSNIERLEKRRPDFILSNWLINKNNKIFRVLGKFRKSGKNIMKTLRNNSF